MSDTVDPTAASRAHLLLLALQVPLLGAEHGVAVVAPLVHHACHRLGRRLSRGPLGALGVGGGDGLQQILVCALPAARWGVPSMPLLRRPRGWAWV